MATKEERAKIEIEYEAMLRRDGKFPGPYQKEHEILKSIEMRGALGAAAVFGVSLLASRYTKSKVIIPVGLLGAACYMQVYSAVYAVLSFSRVCESERSKIAEITCPEILASAHRMSVNSSQQSSQQGSQQGQLSTIASMQVQSCLDYFKRKQIGAGQSPVESSSTLVNQPIVWNTPSSVVADSTSLRGDWQTSQQPSWSSSSSPSLSGVGIPSAQSSSYGLLRDRRHRRIVPHQEQQEVSEIYEVPEVFESHFEPNDSTPKPTADDSQIAKWQELYQKRKARRNGGNETS